METVAEQITGKRGKTAPKSGVGGILLFWIPSLILTALAMLASLAFSQENIPSAPSGKEQAVMHLAASLFTEGELSLSDQDASAFLFPVLQNAFSEGDGLTGFSMETGEKNEVSIAMGFRVSGSRLGIFCRGELLPEQDGYYGFQIHSASIGKLPIPTRCVLSRAESFLSSFGKVEEDTIWIPASMNVPLWEGTEPLTLKLTKLSAENGKWKAEIAAESIPLELLGKFLQQ